MEFTLQTRKLSDVSGVRWTTVRRILNHREDDFNRCLQFSENISDRISGKSYYVLIICFSDKWYCSPNGEKIQRLSRNCRGSYCWSILSTINGEMYLNLLENAFNPAS